MLSVMARSDELSFVILEEMNRPSTFMLMTTELVLHSMPIVIFYDFQTVFALDFVPFKHSTLHQSVLSQHIVIDRRLSTLLYTFIL